MNRARAPWGLTAIGGVVALAFVLPGVYVLWRTLALSGDLPELWSEAQGPLWRTLQLATTVSLTATAVGTALAWLLHRSDVPMRRLWRVLVPLPLALPSFVGAAAFIAAVAPGGILGDLAVSVGVDGPRGFRGMGAAWLILTLFTYPYVYLPVAARLGGLGTSVEESALLLGSSEPQVLRRVVLPQLAPAMAAGGLLSFLYTLSDFGAVQLLGFDTLTRVIFATRLSDRAVSFTAGSLVVILAVVVAIAARRLGAGMGAEQRSSLRAGRQVSLGAWRLPALALPLVPVVLGLVVPLLSLAVWAWRGLSDGRVGFSELVEPAGNTVAVSVAAAVAGMAAVLPVALLTTRFRSRIATSVSTLVLAGFAVPGLVVALALVFWTLNTPGLAVVYQTFPLLVAAYVVHFGSQALGGAEVAVAAVPGSVRESAELLGAGRLRRILRVELPLMRPGLQAGGGLVLLSTFKELPATLLLAPIGFTTLATSVWGSFEDGFFAEVGLAGLALVAVAGVLSWFLVLRAPTRLARA